MAKAQYSSAAALLAGVAVLMAALLLEGGRLAQVLQPAAALIVLGGTASAVAVQFSLPAIRRALGQTRAAFRPSPDGHARREQMVRLALQARRAGLLSLDAELKTIPDPFFRRALMLAVDGVGARELREIMMLELDRLEEDADCAAHVWEAAGGFAPTIGILGAVLGLIQVMQRLDDMHAVGQGIAVAFVATLYGVGSANLIFLPLAGKLRLHARDEAALRERTLEGVLAIVDGVSPRLLRERFGGSAPLAVPAAAPPGGDAASPNLRQMARR